MVQRPSVNSLVTAKSKLKNARQFAKLSCVHAKIYAR